MVTSWWVGFDVDVGIGVGIWEGWMGGWLCGGEGHWDLWFTLSGTCNGSGKDKNHKESSSKISDK